MYSNCLLKPGHEVRILKREHNKQELFKWKENYFLEVSTISVGGTTLWWMLPKIEIRNLFHRTAPTVTDFRLESRPRAFLSEIELFLSFKHPKTLFRHPTVALNPEPLPEG